MYEEVVTSFNQKIRKNFKITRNQQAKRDKIWTLVCSPY